MKKHIAFLSLLLVFSFLFTACEIPGSDKQTTTEKKEDLIPVELPETTMYLVGDSTVASFSDQYFYPRYGYGTQIGDYLSDKVTVKNLALSGRSSKSFIIQLLRIA